MDAKTSTPRPRATSTPLRKSNDTQAAQSPQEPESERASGSNSGNGSPSVTNELDYLGQPPSQVLSESSDSRNTDRPARRKQSIPKKKKRQDRVTAEIIKQTSSTNLLIPKLPFQRVVREVMQQYKQDLRIQTNALLCLQEALEIFMVHMFEDSYRCCMHRKCVTLHPRDVQLVRAIQRSFPGN